MTPSAVSERMKRENHPAIRRLSRQAILFFIHSGDLPAHRVDMGQTRTVYDVSETSYQHFVSSLSTIMMNWTRPKEPTWYEFHDELIKLEAQTSHTQKDRQGEIH